VAIQVLEVLKELLTLQPVSFQGSWSSPQHHSVPSRNLLNLLEFHLTSKDNRIAPSKEPDDEIVPATDDGRRTEGEVTKAVVVFPDREVPTLPRFHLPFVHAPVSDCLQAEIQQSLTNSVGGALEPSELGSLAA
jgi:hypothetical protein